MKSSDQVKSGLMHCAEDWCKGCPYDGDCMSMNGFSECARDALEYVQQLENKIAYLDKMVPRWCSVKEDPPKENGMYLVLFEDESMADIEFDKDEEGGFGWWKEYFDLESMAVTDREWVSCATSAYWMERPELPEGFYTEE